MARQRSFHHAHRDRRRTDQDRGPRRRFRRLPRLEALEDRTLLSNVTWTGGGDGENWGDARNWDTQMVPGSGDDVTIDVDGTTIVNGYFDINSLTCNSSLDITGELKFEAPSTVHGDVSITQGALIAASNLDMGGNLSLDGSLIGPGTVGVGGTFTWRRGGDRRRRDDPGRRQHHPQQHQPRRLQQRDHR